MPHDPARVDLDAEPPLLEDALCLARRRVAVDPAVPLTEFAWAFRYPGDHPTPTAEEVRQGLDTARRTVAALVARLPEEAVPPSLRDQIS